MGSISIVALLVVSAKAAVCIGVGPPFDRPTAQPLRQGHKLIIPWMEANAPTFRVSRWAAWWPDAELSRPDISFLDHCLEGLAPWDTVTDTVILVTKPGKSRFFYTELMRRRPSDLHIIGGLKTHLLPGGEPKDKRPYDFADPPTWRRLAREAAQIAGITGTNVVVLDNETALKRYNQGEATIDYDKLRRSLAPLRETGVQFWWHPIRVHADTASFPDRHKHSVRLVKTIVDAVPDSVFLTAYTAWHGWERNRGGEVDLRRELIDLVGPRRVHDRLFVTSDGYWHWKDGRKRRCFTPEEAHRAIPALPGKVIEIYPGAVNWVSVAREFARLNQQQRRGEK
jgi:hypothetical protein